MGVGGLGRRERLQWQEEISEPFFHHVSVPRRALLFLLLVSAPVSSPREPAGAAEWEAGLWPVSASWISHNHLRSCFVRPALLLLRGQAEVAVSMTHVGWRLMLAARTEVGVSPRPWGC